MISGWKAMSNVKSFVEAVEVQTSLMRPSVENAVASTGRDNRGCTHLGGGKYGVNDGAHDARTDKLTSGAS
jgi:hypothetical protein